MSEPLQTPDIDARQAARLAAAGEVLLLDVREDDEWDSGHAPGAVHTALGLLDPASVPTDRPVIAVCRSGKRSAQAARTLAAAGHNVRNLTGGMQAWDQAGLPVLRADGSAGEVT